MVQVYTNLTTRESARRERFEPTGNVTATNVQTAIQQVDAEAAGKVEQVGTIRKPASAANVAILTSDIEVGIDTRSTAVSATLPSAAAWSAQNPNGLELVLNDYFGNAATNNITPSLFAGDTFAYGSVTPTVNANFGLLRLRPDPSLPGWVVRGIN
jgi:hypothetical protein